MDNQSQKIKLIFLVNGQKRNVDVEKSKLILVPYFNIMFGSSYKESTKHVIHIQIEVTKTMVEEYLNWLEMLAKFGTQPKDIRDEYHKIMVPKTEANNYLELLKTIDLNLFLENFIEEDGTYYAIGHNGNVFTFYESISLAHLMIQNDILYHLNQKEWNVNTFKLAFYFNDTLFIENAPRPSWRTITNINDVHPEMIDYYCNKYIEDLPNTNFITRMKEFCNRNPEIAKIIWTLTNEREKLLYLLNIPNKKMSAIKKLNTLEDLIKYLNDYLLTNKKKAEIQEEITDLLELKNRLKQGVYRFIYVIEFAKEYTNIDIDRMSDRSAIYSELYRCIDRKIQELQTKQNKIKPIIIN